MDNIVKFNGKTYARPFLNSKGAVHYTAAAATSDGRWSTCGGMSQHSAEPSLRRALGMMGHTDKAYVTAATALVK